VDTARKNLGLLSSAGFARRREELNELAFRFGKSSHREALASVDRLERLLVSQKTTGVEVFQRDALAAAPVHPDILLCDLPYGALTSWSGTGDAERFLAALALTAGPHTVAAVVYARQTKLDPGPFRFLERQQVGKRRFAILALA
jgi:hypothetical protein